MRPSTSSGTPLRTNLSAVSAASPRAAMRCHSVASAVSPSLPRKRSVVARVNFATLSPAAVRRVSGSRPALPSRVALFMFSIGRISFP